MSEERDLDGFSVLHPLSLGNEYLPGVFASVLAVQTWHTILFRMVTFLEGLKGCHEVMTTSHTGGNDPFGNTSRNGALDDSCHRVHGTDDLGLELWWHVKLDLLEEIFRSTETTDNQNILKYRISKLSVMTLTLQIFSPVGFCFELEWR